MRKLVYIISAAGGNSTAIQVLEDRLDRADYAKIGRELINSTQYAKFDVEQAGFIIPKDKHFEMSGGEFCGNAARAAAILLGNTFEKNQIEFTMSGFPNTITGNIEETVSGKYNATCIFPSMPLTTKSIEEEKAVVVDLGGIVHVVIEGDLPEDYENCHRRLSFQLGLRDRSAVGVIWMRKQDNGVVIDPVVWVKEVDSFFYETSCGSGSIAAAKVANQSNVIQPTGQSIKVFFDKDDVTLKSEMKILTKDHKDLEEEEV